MRAIRRLQFCAGHRVLNHESKCANAHGHNYVIYFYAKAPNLDSIGRVIDFSVIKEKMNTWIEDNWDHSFLIYKEDKELLEIQNILMKNKKAFICDFNPTAENMADFLIKKICPELFKGTDVEIVKKNIKDLEINLL